jgi:hypothetical protein
MLAAHLSDQYYMKWAPTYEMYLNRRRADVAAVVEVPDDSGSELLMMCLSDTDVAMRNRVLAWRGVEPDAIHSPVPGALPLNATFLVLGWLQ